MLGGAALNFASINPIKALFWSAVINGVVAVPVMAVMMLMGRNRKIMGEFVLDGWLLTVGWLAIAVIWPQRSQPVDRMDDEFRTKRGRAPQLR
jgi:Mn2+/Fe2+ NRAMP family transporter